MGMQPDHSAKQLALRIVRGMSDSYGAPTSLELAETLSDMLANTFEECFGQVDLPRHGESCAVALENPKTAALFFDRIWIIGRPDGRTRDLTFSGGTSLEIWIGALQAAHGADEEFPDRLPFDFPTIFLDSPIHDAMSRVQGVFDTPAIARMIAQNLFEERGIHSIPMFSSSASQQQAYSVGDRCALVSSVTNLGIIDEEALTWDQVADLREDSEALEQLRALRHWVDSTMEGESIDFVTDAIGVRLQGYERTLRKHGIKTLIGSMQSVLDPRFLTATAGLGASLGITAGAHAGIGAVGVAVVGKTALSIGEAFLNLADARHGEGAEVAFLHEIKKLQS